MFHSLCSYPFQHNDLCENENYGKMESRILTTEFHEEIGKVLGNPEVVMVIDSEIFFLTLYIFNIFHIDSPKHYVLRNGHKLLAPYGGKKNEATDC